LKTMVELKKRLAHGLADRTSVITDIVSEKGLLSEIKVTLSE